MTTLLVSSHTIHYLLEHVLEGHLTLPHQVTSVEEEGSVGDDRQSVGQSKGKACKWGSPQGGLTGHRDKEMQYNRWRREPIYKDGKL